MQDMESTQLFTEKDSKTNQFDHNSTQNTTFSLVNSFEVFSTDNDEDQQNIFNNQQIETQPKKTNYLSKKIYLSLIVVLLGLYFGYIILTMKQKPHSNDWQIQDEYEIIKPASSLNISLEFVHTKLQKNKKNIDTQQLRHVWVLLRSQENALNAEDIFILNFIQKKVNESGLKFQKLYIKQVYDRLSKDRNQIITNTMHKRKFNFHLSQLLGLALLIEHGGILIDLKTVFLIDNLNWTLSILEGKQLPKGFPQIKFPEQGKPEVLLTYSKSQNKHKGYFIAAKAGSQFLQDIFMEMVALAQLKVWPFQDIVPAMKHHSGINMNAIFLFFQSILSVKIKKAQMQALKTNNVSSLILPIASISIDSMNSDFTNPNCQGNAIDIINSPKSKLENKCGKIYFMMFGLAEVIRNKLNYIIDSKDISKVFNESLLYELINVQKNKQYWAPYNDQKNEFFCIIASQPSSLAEIKSHFLQIQNQKYKKWKVIYFTTQNIPADNSPKANMKILNHTGNLGYNLQQAITKNCPMKSIVFLLQVEEKLSSDNFLNVVVQKVKEKDVFAASINLQKDNEKLIIEVDTNFVWPHGVDEFKENIPQLKNILNGMRFFLSDYYRMIPRFDLRKSEGQFYEDFTVVLVEILNFGNFQTIPSGITKYRAEKFIDMAYKFEKITGEYIKIKHLKEPNLKQAQYTQKKNPAKSLWDMIHWAVTLKIDIKKVFVFNTGGELPKPSQTPLIPQKIHQIWIEGAIPPIKIFISNRAKMIYPNYEYILWTKENITKQNFPFTYRILQTLLQFEKDSPYSKYAMISDLMRQELIYHHGGFYFDFNFQVLRPVFDRWRRYKLVLGAQKTHMFRSYQGFCFFGSVPKNPVFLRLLNYTNTNSINIYSIDANNQTGPFNFRQIINQTQEYDPQILLMSFDTVYPDSSHQDKCIAKTQSLRPQQIGAEQKGLALIKNCSRLYPLHYTMEHFVLGGSWVKRKPGK